MVHLMVRIVTQPCENFSQLRPDFLPVVSSLIVSGTLSPIRLFDISKTNFYI